MPITLREIGVRFGSTKALDSFSFTFPKCGIVALIGENGAGKTTVLDVLSGFIKHTSGEVVNSESEKQETRAWLRSHCGKLYQNVVLPTELTPKDYLSVVRFPERARWIIGHGPPRDTSLTEVVPELIACLLDMASVDVKLPIAVHSWGQQRAVALAAVLMVQKSVLLLDEPFSSLSGRLLEYASRLVKDEGLRRLIVFAEHDIPHAMEIADTVLVLKAGQLKTVVSGRQGAYTELLQYFG